MTEPTHYKSPNVPERNEVEKLGMHVEAVKTANMIEKAKAVEDMASQLMRTMCDLNKRLMNLEEKTNE